MKKDIILKDLTAIQIQEYQQNRYPCFFIDYIDTVVVGKTAIGYKNFTYNEWFFPAHFIDEPNVPGFVLTECMAQIFLMTFLTIPQYKGSKTAVLQFNSHFKKKIIPGNRLDLEADLSSFIRGIACGHVVGTVNGELACQLDLKVCIPEIVKQYIPHVK